MEFYLCVEFFSFTAATVITTHPGDKTVNASETVTFECEAVTDEEEKEQLEIKWLKDGEEIDYEREPTITMNKRVRYLVSNIIFTQIQKGLTYKRNLYYFTLV